MFLLQNGRVQLDKKSSKNNLTKTQAKILPNGPVVCDVLPQRSVGKMCRRYGTELIL